MCLYFFLIKPSQENMNCFHSEIVSHQEVIETLAFDTGKVMEDSTLNDEIKLSYLGNKVIFLENQYGNFLNDIRQETNYHIEYINAWLSVWIAILALICGVAPALFQYRLYIINRRKLREELELYEQIMSCHEINNYINSVIHCMDAQIVSDSSQSRKFVNILLRKSIDSFDKLLNILFKDTSKIISPQELEVLLTALIQLSGMLDKIKIRVRRSNSTRRLSSITDRISCVIKQMTEPNLGSTDNFMKQLYLILDNLRNFSNVWDFI